MVEVVNQEQDAVASSSAGAGIMYLPTDTLIQIIDVLRKEAEAEDTYGRKRIDRPIVQLSGVSKLFRAVVLEHSSLWTRVTNEYILRDGFQERIARTKNTPLSFELIIHTEWEQIISPIFPYKDRRKTIYAEIFSQSRKIAKALPNV